MWNCEKWKCLQTIKFITDPSKPLRLRVNIDKTASYLVLNDMDNQDLYVVQVEKAIRTSIDDELPFAAGFKSIAKFSLASPILSFFITDAAVRRYKCGGHSDAFLVEDVDDYDEETNSIYCVVLQMFFVQPKSVQKCNLMYQPQVQAESVEVGSSIGDGSIADGKVASHASLSTLFMAISFPIFRCVFQKL